MPNDWTYHAALTDDDSFNFYHAIGLPVDCIYKPIVVAKQIANGINYRFVCTGTSDTNSEEPHFCLISIHKPFSENGYVVEINPIDLLFPYFS